MLDKNDIRRRADEYAKRHQRVIVEDLGSGVHGSVFLFEHHPEVQEVASAIKVHGRAESYQRERDVYLRLQAHGITQIRGCNVPRMLHFDDDLWIIEMTVVARPFVLDFAGAHLDRAPEFSDEVWADWIADKQDQFGQRWPDVQAIMGILQTHGIYLEDVNPGNISWPD